jgi:myo-inositol-1(or 4)-monophosphatase
LVGVVLRAVLYVRMPVPAIHQMSRVAAGRMRMHWQYEERAVRLGRDGVARRNGGIITGEGPAIGAG